MMETVREVKRERRRASTLKKVIIGAVLLSTLGFGIGCARQRLPVAPEVGARAPDFTITDVQDKPLILSVFLANPVVLVFWSTQCPFCHQQLALMQQVYNEKAKDGLVVVAISIGEEEAIVEPFVEKEGYTFAIGLDPQGTVSTSYRVESIPMTFFIDSKGVIQLIHLGAFSSIEEALEKLKLIMKP